jgi:hypothetical protein
MKQFSKVTTISSRVLSIIKSDVESRSEAWLVGLGYADCNDYAQSVVNRVAYTQSGIEHIRFETVARYVRTEKSKIRAKLDREAKAAQLAQPETV